MPIRISKTLKNLLIAYIAVFVVTTGVDQFFGGSLRSFLELVPNGIFHGRIWQLFTFSFIHSDVMHLVLNLLVLAFVGADIEALWGTRKFLTFYFFCILMSGFFYLMIQLMMSNPLFLSRPLIGASGGVYGLLLTYGILFPDREMLFMMLFPMKARQFVWVLAGVEFMQAIFSGQGGLGALAHLSGMGAGFLYLWLQAKGFRFKSEVFATKRKKGSSHLRLVKGESKDDDSNRGPKTWH
jgi:membrane associated rhomboid family serine protease